VALPRRLQVLLLALSFGVASCASSSRSPGTSSRSSQPPRPQPSSQAPTLQVADGSPLCPSRATIIGVAVQSEVTARSAPDVSARAIATLPRINQQGSPQVFDVLADVTGSDGQSWTKVLLPLRPNGTTGYVRRTQIHMLSTLYAIGVSRRHLTLTVWKECQQVATYPIGLGTRETPTPTGVFYLASLLRPPDPKGVYGEYAYGLSGYSSAITHWTWGGLIGLHGTNDPSSVGKLSSHGCIRMRNGDIAELVKVLPLGTPIAIA
jgi:lipoprotein-anchoring transpeptidase ErfK/SrfK